MPPAGSVSIYAIDQLSEDQLLKLASYGARNLGDSYHFEGGECGRMTKLSIACEHIPIMATMVRKVLASRRLTEHVSFCKWMERGGIHGMDQDDWFGSEHEEGERVRCVIRRLSI